MTLCSLHIRCWKGPDFAGPNVPSLPPTSPELPHPVERITLDQVDLVICFWSILYACDARKTYLFVDVFVPVSVSSEGGRIIGLMLAMRFSVLMCSFNFFSAACRFM